MNRYAFLVSILLLSSLLAGCHVPPSGPPNPAFVPTCIRKACTVDPRSKDAQYMLTTYGLHQFILDAYEGDHYRPQIEGNLVVWQYASSASDKGRILGYDLNINSLFNVSDTNDVIHSEAFLAKGKVVYSSQPADDNLTYTGNSWMTLWDSKTRDSQRIETGFNGSDDSWGFDGEWLLFGHRYSSNPGENALWAMNLDTGAKVRLYVPVSHGREKVGSWLDLDVYTVSGGHAYYAETNITWAENKTVASRSVKLNDVELATNQTRLVLEAPEQAFARVAVEGQTMIWESGLQERLLNLTTGQVTPLSTSSQKYAGFPSLAGNWAFYNAEPDPTSAYSAVYGRNLKTGANLTFDGSQRHDASFTEANTDGHRVVLFGQVYIGQGGNNLYWADLP